ncbi:hypothetical protein BKH42_08210 [Helicobacter sp. 13S00482-2]|uniref:VirB4 family type IV secretion/conjugal transfer ATPase n=1 Tax=Helicobacter sp. 13S00482-2 TaxID=1476200 RepID=UPI000BA7D4BF|nr:FtsK/SpoIIIE domain-containing protein [Helicobacter sp. 13S00482-2]PAF53028.1 hypothetical protein BKH42_08210 [Helicobacter sp. 13S00482-2]
MNLIESIKKTAGFLFAKTLPNHYSIIEENNILGIYNDDFIITKKENLVGMISVDGVNYSNLNQEDMLELFLNRLNALNAIDEGVELKIITKRREYFFNQKYDDISNEYARRIINLWEGKEKVFSNEYILIFESKSANFTSFLEKKKLELTTSIKEEKNTNLTHINKEIVLKSIIQRVSQTLNDLKPKQINSVEILRFYAEYINGVYIPFNPSNGILTDSYIASNVSFHKDYFLQDFNGEKTFNRFIAIKSYDCEEITSLTLSNLLHLECQIDIILSIDPIPKEKAVSKIEEKRKRSSILVKESLVELKELVKTDRVIIQNLSLIVLVKEKNKKNLDNISQKIINIFKNDGMVAVIETINMLPTFFSFFPNRSNLNARRRLQSSKIISSMFLFEKEQTGRNKNSWGNMPLTVFKNQSMSPFLFNFHAEEVKNNEYVLGHTMIIGGTGAGKTTLVSFLMMNAMKYNINILSLDRLYGMNIMTEFFDGEYNSGEEFYINPFALEYSPENISFLSAWLGFLVGINENNPEDIQKLSAIEKVVKDTYHNLSIQGITARLSDIAEGILKMDDAFVQIQLQRYLENPLFNKTEDSLSFKNQLTTLNMDFIVNSSKDASLIAYYLFHKMIYEAKENNKGFFMFIDEFKSYTENEMMNEKLNLAITQARKVNGVIALAFQDINQLDEVKNASSFIENMGHIILFPTKNIEKLEKYGIVLSDIEKEFLVSTSKNERKILLKNRIDNTSNILDVNLSKLGKYLNVFNSNANNVRKLKEYKQSYPNNWKERYLNG